jgi:hypothetical protein
VVGFRARTQAVSRTRAPFAGGTPRALREVMVPSSDVSRVLREAGDQLLVGDAPSLVDELTAALLVVSARVARIRQHVGPKDSVSPVSTEMRSFDEAFSRAVSLARKLSAAIRAHRDSGSYVAATIVARELGRQLTTLLPDQEVCSMRLSADPAIVTMPAGELRRVLVTLVRVMVEGAENGGALVLEIEVERATPSRAAVVRVILGHPTLRAAAAERAADDVREMVNARGGSVEVHSTSGSAAAVIVSLPGVC